MADDGLKLNNKELVGRALDVIQTALQDLIISEMKYNHGLDWWNVAIVPNQGRYKLPIDIPRHPEVQDDEVRAYMDIPVCYAMLKSENLLSSGYSKDANKLLYDMKDVRNKKSHFGKPTYTAEAAGEAIGILIKLDEALDLDVGDELKGILGCVSDEHSASPPQSTESDVPSEGSPDVPEVESEAEPEEETVRIASEVPDDPLYDIGVACMKSCEGMLEQLEIKQMADRSSGRFTAGVVRCNPRQGTYRLTLDHDMVVDDSTGILIDGREFSSNYLSFSGYDRTTHRVTLFPGPEVREAIEKVDDPGSIVLFTDMKWLIGKTLEFFQEYGGLISYPNTPQPFASSAFLSAKFEDMSPDQEAAVKMIMSRPFSYVWGVPGSGKTQYVLATAINECVRRGEKVAVIAPTNLSLEQVLRGLMRSFDQDESCTIDKAKDVVRIGNPTSEFMAEFATICEDKKVRNELNEKKARLNKYQNTLHERRYEELRGLCDEADALSGKLDQSEASAERLFEVIRPLREEMLGDPRFESNARMINTRSVRRVLGPLRNMIYGRDRSEFLEGDMAELGDDRIRSMIGPLEAEIEGLSISDPKADINSCKVISMTLSKFIASFGPSRSGGRYPLKVDRIFVDEAGYCNVVQLMALFTMGVPITLLGDHMQLPPVCEIDRDTFLAGIVEGQMHTNDCFWDMSALYADSFFDDEPGKLAEMYSKEADPEFKYTSVASLATTHRFGQNLADALGRQIYGRRIVSANSQDLAIRVLDAHIDSFPSGKDGLRRSNIAESEVIGRYIEDMAPEDYAVLTPYNQQVWTLKRNRSIPDDHVLTIHKSQSREWDTVIISVCDCRACSEEEGGKSPRFTSTVWDGGAAGKKVINTALSRAKKELVIVCDTEYWLGRDGELIGDLVRSAMGTDAPTDG